MRASSLLALLAAPVLLLPAESRALRVMAYNVLNYSSGREAQFREVLAATQPDVLVLEEVLSQAAVDRFLDLVLDPVSPGEWTAGSFTDGADTDNAFFYRPARVAYVSHFVIGTALRDIDEWTFRPAEHSSEAANVRIYVVHLKASQGISNEQQRLAEVGAMRTRMETFPAGQCYLVAGDFNFYTATEPAYLYLTSPANGTAGVVQDPIGREGNWHVNPDFADIHTQSPRVLQFGGGANGGLDDRFDLILVGPAVQDGEGFDVLEETYEAFGQDGEHFDGAINVAPYTVVDSVMAENLHAASDHLPVLADFQTWPVLDAAATLDLGSAIVGGTASATLAVANVASPPADELDYSLAAPPGFAAPAGPFTADAGAPANLHAIEHSAISTGFHTGDLDVATDDPDHPAHVVALTATVLAHAAPSVAPDEIVLEAPLDLGTVAAGDTVTAAAVVHDVFQDAFQASLEVWDATLGGDPRFFLPGGFGAFPVGVGAPGSLTVAFDAAGAGTGIHVGTLTLATRDDPGLSGATDLADLTFDLTVTVGGMTDAAPASSSVRPGIRAVAPNPFGTTTTVRFGATGSGSVEVRVYDVRGREVRTLAAGTLPAGVHERSWDGRDAGGRELAPGVYFARYVGGGVVETRKLLRLR